MILNNVKPVSSDKAINVKIDGGKIDEISSMPIVAADAWQLYFDDAIIFPGLINSHDHLDFNLFPQLGDKIYNNYTEWGKYIHERYQSEISFILKIPVELRYKWGIYKNLLCGVTTVVNHDEKPGPLTDLINVFQNSHCIHSLGFEKRWKFKLNNPLKKQLPVNIHLGEGVDLQTENEVPELLKWNILNRKLIAVHAVAMNEAQADKFDAVVWCPQSNYFLLNKTAPVNLLKIHTNILFGTDSTLTSEWDIWAHLRSAKESHLLTDEELYNTLTINPAQTWKLNSGEIKQGKAADLVVARANHKMGFGAFYDITPADIVLVIYQGEIKLFDEELLTQLVDIKAGFSKIHINGVGKYVKGDLPALMAEIRKCNPDAAFPSKITIPG